MLLLFPIGKFYFLPKRENLPIKRTIVTVHCSSSVLFMIWVILATTNDVMGVSEIDSKSVLKENLDSDSDSRIDSNT